MDGYDEALGRHVQFAGYEELEPLTLRDVGDPPLLADLVLGRSRVRASQIVKQADVLMAHHLIPESMRPGTLPADLDFYLPRTTHGSSLSPGVHASLLARAGRLEEAAELLGMAIGFDLGHGDPSQGLHLAALASVWHALALGFAGIAVRTPDDPALVLDPHIPERWGALSLSLRWHGRRVRLRCTPDAVHVAPEAPLAVAVGGAEPVVVGTAGRWVDLA